MSTSLEYVGKEKRERKSVIVDHELEKIYRRHKSVTVEAVLKEAEKPSHALHSYFEWDDAEAGRRYRAVQAYALIIGSKFIVNLIENGETTPRRVRGSTQVRRLLSVYRGEGFRMRVDVLKDSESRSAVVETKRAQLRSWCNSVVDLDELNELRESILAKL